MTQCYRVLGLVIVLGVLWPQSKLWWFLSVFFFQLSCVFWAKLFVRFDFMWHWRTALPRSRMVRLLSRHMGITTEATRAWRMEVFRSGLKPPWLKFAHLWSAFSRETNVHVLRDTSEIVCSPFLSNSPTLSFLFSLCLFSRSVRSVLFSFIFPRSPFAFIMSRCSLSPSPCLCVSFSASDLLSASLFKASSDFRSWFLSAATWQDETKGGRERARAKHGGMQWEKQESEGKCVKE